MSESDIKTVLSNDYTRFVARFCKTPRTTGEIVLALLRERASSDRALYERLVADSLTTLENLKAITYAGQKWKTNENALAVLSKYYGE